MGTALQIIPNNILADGFSSYLQKANTYPLLSHAEETALAKRYLIEQDLEAAQKLVLSHIRYVIRIAKGYTGYGLLLADLVQEGTIGLMKAVKRFDPEKGFRLVSFAVHWIKSEIHDFVIKNWRIVKIATTKAQRKLFFNLRKNKKRLGWFTKEEVKTVAEDLGVPIKEVYAMESRLNNYDQGFDAPYHEEGETPAEHLTIGAKENPELLLENATQKDVHTENLHQAMLQLDDRSRDIVKNRWLAEKKTTLKALAEKYKISLERIRQLEKNAMEKLKDLVSEA